MSADSKLSFAKPSTSKAELEEGTAFTPRFDEHGLIGAIVTGADGVVLMFAFMNAEALRLTIETGEAHFYSRSRKSLWKKGETSGNVLRVRELLTDCDQDILLVKVELQGEAACHTGRRSCFYRRVEAGADGVALEFVTK
ncbi:phosphoribosyl-AMP cyclohydrolase [Rhodomicrobium udaipurense JA643]|uniref:Phosphoribosyl-AMP cyclohydrolase n=1 Tax=Rhodomicrobium udaipurense TaxID=1202716 RepID=A0A8I1KKZ5_9HYPH|nr:phosphoribosyl-AMP cyclohydrolase [Rhodomicrobium udaipurense]KAI93664.1 phosphoribosyl-AMP cyclohydrolase [Rhodomicrobium udaipurense JA643]MBJ7542563.1 phosphoribosyl-AMP cyclohydrolase [Rhodomicrobium udaipurense]